MRQSLIRLRHRAKPYLRWLWPWIIRGRAFLRWLPVQKIPVSSKYFGRPKGLYRTTHDYLASPAGRDGLNRSHEIYPAETLRFTPPTPLDGGEVHWKFLENQVKDMPASHVFELENARFWGHYAGSIITPDDRLLADLSHDVLTAENHKVFAKFMLPHCQRLRGTVAVLATAEAATNYWHWTFDLLPRLHLLEKAGFTPANVDFYLVNHTRLPFQLETLAELGIGPEQIIQTDGHSHFEADRLVVSSLKPGQFFVTPWVCQFLYGLVPPTGADRPATRRLYVSRADCSFRRLSNEDEIFKILQPLGFELIACENLGVREQRTVFNQAEIVIAPHGSGLTNLVYCRPGTRLLEIFSPRYVDLAFWTHACHSRLVHEYVLGDEQPVPVGADPMDRTADISVSPEAIEKWLAQVAPASRFAPV